MLQFLADLQVIVDAGAPAFDNAAIGTLLSGSIVLVDALTQIDCSVIRP